MRSGTTPSGRSRADWLTFLLGALVVANVFLAAAADQLRRESEKLREQTERVMKLAAEIADERK